ncbi:MAG: FeoB-associated Cys-rich membrane protein [Ruminococcus sp.]|nr:FeoB-associated Cys-rich membrane protein [Ruminococcus sp.]MDE6102191.1 FeoB-associated Cys-rich membrane protein [Ruminococcus sp.]
MNAGTVITGLILIAIIAMIIIRLVSDKKKGKSSCGCNCGCCPNSENCHGNRS